ncbi:amino acid permease [Blastococcus sp. PRF04-17]|uniref:amino acid permease n=1 Tax=Blastococcus sp. PRF04-17 TaxID=2933797 RepID=UPI001FF4175F|nr:amino acid permease [Blastococcus sp. PRF04-17]UOY01969.1 amino acid permease [Blastococcus sp. PRF04-17]
MSAPHPRGASGITYKHAEEGYFDKRGLTRTAGFWGLWGLGVAAVISGDFSGWNFGVGGAGWGGFLIATVVVTLMYVAMIASIGEMSAAMPHTGGAYSFARSAMGPWGGFVTGLAETIEYVATTAVIVYFSASYADSITDELFGLSMPGWMWWIILYAIFLLLNIAGAEVSFRFAVVVAVLSLAVIALFAVMALFSGALDFGNLFDIEPTDGNSEFVPFGWWQVVLAMPFAMWLYLGIEELPLAAEESHMPARDIPRAGLWGLGTLIVSGGIVLVLNPAVVGASAIGSTDEPLLDGFRAILPNSDVAAILSAFALIGLFASLQGIMFAYGRNIYSLSRAGYYPKALSLTGARRTPWIALVVGAVIGFAALLGIQAFGDTVGDVVLNIAVWGAVLAYLLQMVSFVLLRRKFPTAGRPYRSPFGVAGAVFAGAIAALIFVGVMLNEAYREAIVAVAVIYVVALVGFAAFGRHRLVLSPEEEYAMSGGLHGDPQAEGYGAIDVEDIDPEARSSSV